MNFLFKILLINTALLFAAIPYRYSINDIYNSYNYRVSYESGFPNQSIIDFRGLSDNNIVVGTGNGLGIITTNDNYITIIDSNLPEGGNPSLEVYSFEDIIITSGVRSKEDLDYDGEVDSEGTGISWSIDNGDSWNFIDQPIDESADCSQLTCNDPIDPDNCECYPSLIGGTCYWDGSVDICKPGSNIAFDWNNQNLYGLKVDTKAQNITYDVSADIVNEYIYAASWGSMLRRFKYSDINPSWELVALPMDNETEMGCGELATYPSNYVYNPIDPPTGSNNHKAFSVFVDNYDDETYIWAGTANGINIGKLNADGCIDWKHFTADENGLAGDWIIDIVPQDIGSSTPRIWLISWTLPSPSPHGLTYIENYKNFWNDNGNPSWKTINQFSESYIDVNDNDIYDIQDNFTDCWPRYPEICDDGNDQWDDSYGNDIFDGAIVYNLYFVDQVDLENQIYFAATNRGLYWSTEQNILNSDYPWTKVDIPDFVLNQLHYIEIPDENIFYEEKIYSCILRDNNFYIGTPNGLVSIKNIDVHNPNSWGNNSWEVYIASEQELVEKNKLNSFPNPLILGNTSSTSFVNFEYKSSVPGEITIFDFAMNKVNSIECAQDINIPENLKCSWDGYNMNRVKVANGVYFCRLKTPYSESWTKVMVINTSGDYQ